MGAPLCVCNGLIRSGSTWSFNVCRALMQALAGDNGKPFGSCYLHGPNLETFVGQHWRTAPGPTVIKAHELGPMALNALQSGSARGVCTFRDPRDCVASDLVFMGFGLDASIKRVNGSLECLRSFESTEHILYVRYEEMMANPRREIHRIARHLKINAPDHLIDLIDARTNLQSTRAVCRQLKDRPAKEVLNIQSHRVDPVTHLHENHVDSAKVGRWKDELSVDQGQYLTEYFSTWLLKWGYETQATLKKLLSGSGQYIEGGVPAGAGQGGQGRFEGNFQPVSSLVQSHSR